MQVTQARPEADAASGIKFEELARSLEVLGNANRLRLLHQLVRAKAVSEIDLQPESVREGENPERRISRQGVQLHLERLSSIGMLSTTREHRGRALVEVHSLNYPRLYALTEEFRGLGQLRPAEETVGVQTLPAPGANKATQVKGPQLVIVRGLREGTIIPLTEQNRSTDGGWIMGRKRGLAVCLDYDPYVSAENSEFRRRGDGTTTLVALPGSRNGTHVNFEPLRTHEERPLRHGDVIGVGRSLLVFWNS